MATKHKVVVSTIKSLKARGVGQKKTAKLLSMSKRTVQRVLQGNANAGTRIAPRVAASIKATRSTLPKRPRAALPPQLRQLNATIYRKIKLKCRAYGYEICARWWMTTPAALEAHVMSRSKEDATELLHAIERLGIPELQLDDAFMALITAPSTQESQA